MRCLDDPDDTLKRKTLELLCRITGPENVSVICTKLIEYLESVTDQFIRGDLARKITEIAEKHAPNHEWFLVTVSRVFRLAGDLVAPKVAHNLMRLIAEGIDSGDEEVEKEFRVQAVTIFSNILLESDSSYTLPDSLIRITAWVLSEYVYLCPSYSPIDTASRLARVFREGKRSATTQNWILQSVIKLALHDERVRSSISTLFAQSNLLLNIDTQQRWNEYNGILSSTYKLDALHPLDASCEDLGIDSTLGFLSKFSGDAGRAGAPVYKPAHVRKREKPKQPVIEINYKPYEAPTKPPPKQILPPVMSSQSSMQMTKFTPLSSMPLATAPPPTQPTETTATQSANRPWSMKGYKSKISNPELNSFETPKVPLTNKLSTNFTNSEVYTSECTHTVTVEVVPREDPKRREANSIFGHLTPGGGGGILSQERRGRRSIPSPSPAPRQEAQLLEPQPTNQDAALIPDEPVQIEQKLTPQLVPDSNTSLFSDTLLDPTVDTSNTKQEPEPEPEQNGDLSQITLDSEGGFDFINETFPLAHYNPNKGVELSPELNQFPKDEQNFLVSDPNIRVTYVKVFKPDTLVLYLVLTNQQQDQLTNIQFKHQLPSNLRHLQAETQNILVLETLDGFESHPNTFEIRCTAPAMNPTMTGELNYFKNLDKTPQRLFFNLLITTRDLMRPLNLSPEDFKKEWSSSLMFKKKTATIAPVGISNLSEFTIFFHQKLNVQEIDRNKNQLLFAGTFLSNVKCLFHTDFNDKLFSSEVTVLSKNNLLTDSVIHFLEKNLK